MSALREAILAANDLHPQEVDTSAEWGHKVFVRVMTCDEYDAWGKAITERPARIREILAVLVTVDAEGAKVFQPGDEDMLAKKGHQAIHKIWNAAGQLNKVLAEKKVEAAAEAA